MYIESGKVKFYPSAYRQYQDGIETKNINPESELNTEYNITSHIAKLLKKSKGSFIVNYVENTNLEFYLGGYYIHITSPQDILNAFPNSTQIWANMKVAPFTPTDNAKGFSELYEVVDYEDNGKNIDEINNNAVSFKGVAFLDTKDSNATFSLCLFSRKDTSSSWYTHTSSEYILDTSEIYNENGDTGISSEFYSLKIKTDDLYAELGTIDDLSSKLGKIDDATINNRFTVDGTATFNKQVDFKGNLVPTNNNQVNIGSSDKEFANIYVNKIMGVSEIDNGQNNITLKSSIEPSGNVNLGSTANPIANVYATNISCTNKIVVNNSEAVNGDIDYATIHNNLDVVGDATFETSVEFAGDLLPTSGSQIDIGLIGNPIANVYADKIGVRIINLKSQLVPDGQVDLGGPSNKFNQIYANETISDGLNALSLNVNDINSGAPNITLYKTILPMSTGSISFGNNTFKFNEIYAKNFYGALTGNVTGNASTATKLKGTNAGGFNNPVYFKDGNPTSSGWDSLRLGFLQQFFNDLPITYTGRGNSSATITDDYLRRGIYFALINFNGDRVNCCFYVDKDIEVSTISSTDVISTNVVHLMSTNYGLGVHKTSSGYEFRVFTASEGGTPGNMNSDTVENVTVLKTPYIV